MGNFPVADAKAAILSVYVPVLLHGAWMKPHCVLGRVDSVPHGLYGLPQVIPRDFLDGIYQNILLVIPFTSPSQSQWNIAQLLLAASLTGVFSGRHSKQGEGCDCASKVQIYLIFLPDGLLIRRLTRRFISSL